jgi:hypothetical protein
MERMINATERSRREWEIETGKERKNERKNEREREKGKEWDR